MKVAHIHFSTESDWKPSALSLEPQLVLCFGNPEVFFGSTLPEQIKQHYPKADIIGCSVSGIVTTDPSAMDKLHIMMIQFEESHLHIVNRRFTINTDYRSAGQGIAQALPHEGLRHVLLFSSGIQVDGQCLAAGLADFLPENVMVSGGVAADDNQFMHTWCWHNDLQISDGCIAIGLYGEALEIGYGSGSGWDRFGKAREITSAEGNVVYAIDNENPRTLYERYLGEYIWDLPSAGQLMPLYSYNPNRPAHSFVRSIVEVNENGALTFSGDMPQGNHVHLLKASAEGLIEGALVAALLAKEHCRDLYEPEIALVVCGSGRPMVLGPREEEEIEKITDVLGSHCRIIGFYGYGEYSPNREGTSYELHNQSISITTLTELI
jgi:hypothetical protein